MKIASASDARKPLSKTQVAVWSLVLALSLLQPEPSPAQAQSKPPATLSDPGAPRLSPIEVAEKNGAALKVSLKDLTKLALQSNLDIAISDTNEDLYQLRVLQAIGSAYDPYMTVGLNVRQSQSANTNLSTASSSGSVNQSDTSFWNLSAFQPVKTGGSFQLNYNTSRSDTNSAFALFSPQYSANTSIQFIQPLWRNFRIDANRNTIRLANLDIRNNESKFKQQVVTTIAALQASYWDLVYAIRDYEIKRESVRLAEITLRDNTKKVEIGTLAPISITEARATMSSREVDMIASEEKIFTVENTLRSVLSNDRTAVIWKQTIVPTESPDFKEVKVGLDEAIDAALRNRPELEQSTLTLERNQMDYELNTNLRKWQFDLTAGIGAVGTAGPQSFDALGKPRNAQQFVGGVGTAYKTVFSEGLRNWSIGFNLTIPLRNRSLDSKLAQIQIEKRQDLMNRKVSEQKIIVEVRNAVQALDTNRKRVDTSGVSRQLAREQLEGEEKRFQAGLSENFRVLQRQQDLSSAQAAELLSLISYKKSTIDLQKAMYTLLEANDYEIAKSSSTNVPNLK